MEIAVAIHKDPGSAYGVTVPALVGCHSAGDTIDEALSNAKEAIIGHIETMLELDMPVDIKEVRIEDLVAHPDYAGAVWGLVSIDLAQLDNKLERVNVSIPRIVLRRIDKFAEARKETRSGLLIRAALNQITAES